MSSLVPCSGCKRHIRVDHDACPFCATVVPSDFAAGIIPAARKRLDRLALFTFATAFAAACSSGGNVVDDKDGGGNDGSVSDGGGNDGRVNDDGGSVALYGAPVDASPFDGNIAPPYGVPPIDASLNDSGNPVPAYGLPPPDGGVVDSGGAVPAYGLPFDAAAD